MKNVYGSLTDSRQWQFTLAQEWTKKSSITSVKGYTENEEDSSNKFVTRAKHTCEGKEEICSSSLRWLEHESPSHSSVLSYHSV